MDRECWFAVSGCWDHIGVSHSGTGYISVETSVGGFFDWESIDGNVGYQLFAVNDRSCNRDTRTAFSIQTGPVADWLRC